MCTTSYGRNGRPSWIQAKKKLENGEHLNLNKKRKVKDGATP
jgi:hypothetical protein